MRIIGRLCLGVLCIFCVVSCRGNDTRQNTSKTNSQLNQKFSNPHTQTYVNLLKEGGFYNADDRRQKVLASTRMISLEGNEFEEHEQKGNGVDVITYFYWSKNLAYQFGVKYSSGGLMELVTLQIHYMDPATGKIATTDRIK